MEVCAYQALGLLGLEGCLNMLTVQLAFELADTNIIVNSADPGDTATGLNRHRGE